VLPPKLITRRLLGNEFVEAEVDARRKIVVLRRSASAFRQLADIEQTIADLAGALPERMRAGFSILIDMRDAPMRASPELDGAFQRYRNETERGFERVAVVVQSALGKIRSDRLKETSNVQVEVFLSIEDALVWLLEQ
jgi:hypothetical protein